MKSIGNPVGLRKFLRPLIWALGMGIAALLTVAIVYLSAAKSNPSGKRIIKGLVIQLSLPLMNPIFPTLKPIAKQMRYLLLDTFMPKSVPDN